MYKNDQYNYTDLALEGYSTLTDLSTSGKQCCKFVNTTVFMHNQSLHLLFW